jgi:hypothetical protein
VPLAARRGGCWGLHVLLFMCIRHHSGPCTFGILFPDHGTVTLTRGLSIVLLEGLATRCPPGAGGPRGTPGASRETPHMCNA